MTKILYKQLLVAAALTATTNLMAQEMTWSPTSTRFSLWTPSADSVKVNIYTEGLGGSPVKTISLTKEATGNHWVGLAAGNQKGRFYTFQVNYKGKWLEENPGISCRWCERSEGSHHRLHRDKPKGLGKRPCSALHWSERCCYLRNAPS